MSAAVAQGAATITMDVDLWVDLPQRSYMKVTNLCLALGFEQVRPTFFSDNKSLLVNFCCRLDGVDSFEEELKQAPLVRFEGALVPALSLASIIKSKTAADRDKDRAMLPFLKYTLQSQKILKKKKLL